MEKNIKLNTNPTLVYFQTTARLICWVKYTVMMACKEELFTCVCSTSSLSSESPKTSIAGTIIS